MRAITRLRDALLRAALWLRNQWRLARMNSPRIYHVTYEVEGRVRRDTLMDICLHRFVRVCDGDPPHLELEDLSGHLYCYRMSQVLRVRASQTPDPDALPWPDEAEVGL